MSKIPAVSICFKTNEAFTHTIWAKQDVSASTFTAEIRDKNDSSGTLKETFTVTVGDYIDSDSVTHTNEAIFLTLTATQTQTIGAGTFYSDLREVVSGVPAYWLDLVINVHANVTQP